MESPIDTARPWIVWGSLMLAQLTSFQGHRRWTTLCNCNGSLCAKTSAFDFTVSLSARETHNSAQWCQQLPGWQQLPGCQQLPGWQQLPGCQQLPKLHLTSYWYPHAGVTYQMVGTCTWWHMAWWQMKCINREQLWEGAEDKLKEQQTRPGRKGWKVMLTWKSML